MKYTWIAAATVAVSLLTACGGGGSGIASTNPSATPASVEISTSAVLLTEAGQTARLSARVLDADGNVLDTPVTWESSHPAQVPVGVDGVVTAQGTGGSAQIFARVGSLKSPPVLLAYTQVAEGAQLVNDAQIVGDPVETDPDAAFSVDNTYSVSLRGVVAPAMGQILINTGNKPVVGRVKAVSTDAAGVHTVTLDMVQIHEALPHLRIQEEIDLSQLPAQIPLDVLADYDVVRQGSRFIYTPKPVSTTAALAQRARAFASGRASSAGSAPGVLVDTTVAGKSLKCTFTTEGAAGAGSPPILLSKLPTFDVEFNPKMFIDYVPEERVLKELVLKAQPNVTASASFEMELDVAVDPKVTCILELHTIPAPVTGIFAVFLSPTVTFSGGVEVSAKASLAGVKIGATSQMSNTVEVGFRQCEAEGCTTVALINPPTVSVKPSISNLVDNVRLEPSIFGYGMVQVGLGSSVFKSLRVDALYLKLGPALNASLQSVNGQIADTDPKEGVSKYSIDAKLKAGLETKFLQAAAWFGLNGLAENLIDESWPMTQSPTGKASASVGSFKAGDRVDVAVQLDQANTLFLGEYNVARVILYRQTGSEPARAVGSAVPAFGGETKFDVSFTADADGQTSELYAFVEPRDLVATTFGLHFELGQVQAPAVASIGTGNGFACAMTGAGAVQCWGDNRVGELGNGSTTDSSIPVSVTGLDGGVASISVGVGHACALTKSGAVKCWGDNSYGQLANGRIDLGSSTAEPVAGLGSNVLAISSGGLHSCALTAAGGVKCWGWNDYGQLGNGDTSVRTAPIYGNTSIWTAPVDVIGLASGVQAISAGSGHTCALMQSGAVKCWGSNNVGQLGNGSNALKSLYPVSVTSLASNVKAIQGTGDHTCALMNSGTTACWGWNAYGQLGNGTLVSSAVPVEVTALGNDVAAIRAGASSTCSMSHAGDLKCWGNNYDGQLGIGSTTGSTTPVKVVGLSQPVSATSVGSGFACALMIDGSAKCWGYNHFGQLGNGTTTDSSTPVNVIGFP